MVVMNAVITEGKPVGQSVLQGSLVLGQHVWLVFIRFIINIER